MISDRKGQRGPKRVVSIPRLGTIHTFERTIKVGIITKVKESMVE